MRRRVRTCVSALALALLAGASAAQETVAVRVLPQPLATNREPFRIGLQMGFPSEPSGLLGAAETNAWLEALRSAELPAVRWPVTAGAAPYNWYQGVGPLELRQPPPAAPQAAGFGTAEFVQLCRLLGAEPVLRVTVPPFVRAGVDAERTREEVQRAADWVAYCNASGSQPLARLRARPGHAEPLRVTRWELFSAGGDLFAGASGAYQEAMRAADRAAGLSVACAEAPLGEAHDRYVGEVLRRLQAADAAERAYFAGWYGALSLANDALARLRLGGGTVFWPDAPEQLLTRAPPAKRTLTERGRLIALFNRFPAQTPLAVEGSSASAQSPFQTVAAWTADGGALVVFVYNSGTEPRRVRLDLTALKGAFAFWAAEQLAADLTARRTAETVPVLRKQKAGSALPQVVLFDSLPASFSRLVIKR